MIYFFIVTVFVISALLASVIIPRILLVSYKKKLFDVPDARKVHTSPVPRLGGISFSRCCWSLSAWPWESVIYSIFPSNM